MEDKIVVGAKGATQEMLDGFKAHCEQKGASGEKAAASAEPRKIEKWAGKTYTIHIGGKDEWSTFNRITEEFKKKAQAEEKTDG